MNAEFILKYVLVAIIYLHVSLSKDLPPYFPICHQNDLKLGECLLNATNTLKPHLEKGFPEFGIPEIDPLVIPMAKLEQDTKSVNYKAMFINMTVKGLSDYKFTEINTNISRLTIDGNVKFNQLTMESDYFITGRVFKTAVNGMGVFSVTFNHTSCSFSLRGHLVERKGHKYYENKNTLIKIHIEKAELDFDNLLNDDEELNKKTNEFISENTKQILEEVKPAIESMIEIFLNDVIHNVANSTSFDVLFPK
ncbi:uncharacterized protein CBL_06219 [Carabus blaptoides fortunei]